RSRRGRHRFWRLTLCGIGRSDLVIGAGHVRLGLGIASGLDRDKAIDGVGLFPAPLRRSELVCCLGLGNGSRDDPRQQWATPRQRRGRWGPETPSALLAPPLPALTPAPSSGWPWPWARSAAAAALACAGRHNSWPPADAGRFSRKSPRPCWRGLGSSAL